MNAILNDPGIPRPRTISQVTGWCAMGHEAPDLLDGYCEECLRPILLGRRRRSLTRWWHCTAWPWLRGNQDPLAVTLLFVVALVVVWLWVRWP